MEKATIVVGVIGFILAVVCLTLLFFVSPHNPLHVLGMWSGVALMLGALGITSANALVP